MAETPITEASNDLSEDIDIATPTGIVSILNKCDSEIFKGFKGYTSLFHDDILQTIENVASHIQNILESPTDGIIVFSGCGTSGRLGFLVARTFNELQRFERRPEMFRYLIAGGDKALFTSQEAPEDDPHAGIAALKKVSAGYKKVVFIGITCGFSAPYVAGQLEHCLDNPGTFVPVLLGFNPAHLARNVKIENWDKTFIQVSQRLEHCSDQGITGYILNPVVGPEPITGSSRMKSGTATKILLETVCLKALADVHQTQTNLCVRSYIQCYQTMADTVYAKSDQLARAMEIAGNSLISCGCIYYLGTDSLALLGLIDASECPPTYGASLDDIRGFVGGGYSTLQNEDGDISEYGRHFRIALENFEDLLLSENDTVFVINSGNDETVLKHIRGKQCKKVLLTVEKSNLDSFDHVVTLDLPTSAFDELIGRECREVSNQMFREIGIKWCLNAISTGAHVMKGKVYRNIMIDLKVSNNKLFHRAVGILQKLCHVTRAEATGSLLKSIYDTDTVTDDILNLPVAQHIQTATPKEKVVVAALVAMMTKCPIQEAKVSLSKQPVIRTAIVAALAGTKAR